MSDAVDLGPLAEALAGMLERFGAGLESGLPGTDEGCHVLAAHIRRVPELLELERRAERALLNARLELQHMRAVDPELADLSAQLVELKAERDQLRTALAEVRRCALCHKGLCSAHQPFPWEGTSPHWSAQSLRERAAQLRDLWDKNNGRADWTEGPGWWRLELVTGGWSKNEELLDDLDPMFHMLTWRKSERGGLHIFGTGDSPEGGRSHFKEVLTKRGQQLQRAQQKEREGRKR